MSQDQPVLPIEVPPNTDEIDLFELFQTIWQERTLITIVTTIVTALALIYAFAATPVYQVQSIAKPAAIKDLDELNGTGVYTLDPKEALVLIGAGLESYETRLDYFRANQELLAPLLSSSQSFEQSFERFNRENIKILRPDAKKDEVLSPYVGIQLQYPKGIKGEVIVNGLVQYAIAIEKQRIASNLDVVIRNKLEQLERKMTAARAGYEASKESEIAKLVEKDTLKKVLLTDELTAIRSELKARRENRIKQLDEAISIATTLGISKPATPSSLAKETRTAGNVIRTEVNNQQYPLYFMGTEALNAERKSLLERTNDDFTSGRIVEIYKELKLLENNRQIEVLEARENEDVFLKEIAELRSEIARINSLNVNMDSLRLVRIDQAAIEPFSPIKPKKTLIVTVGIVLGGMLSVFIVLARSMTRKRKITAV